MFACVVRGRVGGRRASMLLGRVPSEIAAGGSAGITGNCESFKRLRRRPRGASEPPMWRGQQLSMSLARVGESDMVRHRMGTANDLKMLLLWRSSF